MAQDFRDVMENFNFLPHTDADRKQMLGTMGLNSQDQLFSDIPAGLKKEMTYGTLPENGLSEAELQQTLKTLSGENLGAEYACFLGGGSYNRFIPQAVNTIAGRSEFYTAYTPYQPEISQGTLQVIYEFQTMIAELTGMDVANASVYDGGCAVTEAAFMAVRVTRRKHILVARSVHPHYRGILKTYVDGLGEVILEEFDPARWDDVQKTIDPKAIACVILQQPNYFGCLEETEALSQFCDANGALLIVSADPTSLGLLEAPGNTGAHIVVGDIQPLGNNMGYGGPYGGYMATREKYMRQLPGRLVGRTVDKSGQTCYTLTLQTREQHIRREKATSNICTNQALNVLKATVYLTLVGPTGLAQVANLSVQRAHALAEKLTACDGVELLFPDQPFFSEFALKLPTSAEGVIAGLARNQVLAGIDISPFYPEYPNTLLVSVTEMTTPEALEKFSTFFSRSLALSQAGVPSEKRAEKKAVATK